MSKNTSSNSETHPYLLISFWQKVENKFWLNPMYSEKSQDYFNDCVQRWAKRTKKLTSIEPNK